MREILLAFINCCRKAVKKRMKSAARHVRMGLSLPVPKEMQRPMKKLSPPC
jgi:hypothetical protein